MSFGSKWLAVVAAVSLCAAIAVTARQDDTDPNRPPCTTIECRTVERFVKTHYCGESPFGNGPDDGCEIKRPKTPSAGVDVVADYRCEWNENKQDRVCEQYGQPSPLVRRLLTDELRHLGLPAKTNGWTHFTEWKVARAGWSLAVADYSNTKGSELDLCEVVSIIDHSGHETVLHAMPYHKTNIDAPDVTAWAPVDIADVERNGQNEVVLEGDAYEDHWFQVVRVQDGTARIIFSGLGYYL